MSNNEPYTKQNNAKNKEIKRESSDSVKIDIAKQKLIIRKPQDSPVADLGQNIGGSDKH
jgi:hypothetical protein